MDDEKARSERTAQAGEDNLRRTLTEYELRLTEVADLAARVRHEINNPLTGLLGQAQLLLREELSEDARRRVKTIEHLAGRIRDTVAELRDVQRPQPGGAPRAGGALEESTERRWADAPPHH